MAFLVMGTAQAVTRVNVHSVTKSLIMSSPCWLTIGWLWVDAENYLRAFFFVGVLRGADFLATGDLPVRRK